MAQEEPVHFITDFEDISIPGKKYLRETFTRCSNPMDEIHEFQEKNGIILPSLQPMLPLLDLHGVRRLEFHQSVMEELRDKLIQRIEEIHKNEPPERSSEKLKELLRKSFPLIKLPTIQPVVLALLKTIENVEERYLKALMSEPELYAKVDVGVKRYIWQEHQNMFGEEVTKVLISYIRDKEKIFANIRDPQKTFYLLSPKMRRKTAVMLQLSEMVGKNVLLYDTFMQFLRTVYARTQNLHYCTLRVSLLMELHDAGVTDITQMDPVHKFAWCLDASIREKNIESKRLKELQGYMESLQKGVNDSVLGDRAMALGDPYAINFVAQSIIKILYHLINQEALPRTHSLLQFLLRLLNLGLHAYELLNSQVWKEPKLDPAILTRFLPLLMQFMVDDQVRSVNAKLPPDDRESALTIIEHSGPPPDDFYTFVNTDRVATVLAIYYTAQAARLKDRQAVIRVFGALANSHENRAFEDQYMHILVAGLICLGEEFANEELCVVVFDEIFIPALGHHHTVTHLIKLLYHTHRWIPETRLSSLMRIIESLPVIANDTIDTMGNSKYSKKALFNELEDMLAKYAEDKEKRNATDDKAGSASVTSAATGTGSTVSSTGVASSAGAFTPGTPISPYPPVSPSMSPFYLGSGSPFSPMSPMPYQSPFHVPYQTPRANHGAGPSSSSASGSSSMTPDVF